MAVDPSEVAAAISQVSAVFAGGGTVAWTGKRLFGPLIDEIGEGWRERYSKRRKENLARILVNAQIKGTDAVAAGYEVSPRVVNRIVDEGSWAEGPLMAEYFGGIWAASLCPSGDEDRGLVWAALVARLATLDVFMHYVAYDAFRRSYVGREIGLHLSDLRRATRCFIPLSAIMTAGGEIGLARLAPRSVESALNALAREGLIDGEFGFDTAEVLSGIYGLEIAESGVVFAPSLPGIELFVWAHGCNDLTAQAFLSPALDFRVIEGLPTVQGARALYGTDE